MVLGSEKFVGGAALSRFGVMDGGRSSIESTTSWFMEGGESLGARSGSKWSVPSSPCSMVCTEESQRIFESAGSECLFVPTLWATGQQERWKKSRTDIAGLSVEAEEEVVEGETEVECVKEMKRCSSLTVSGLRRLQKAKNESSDGALKRKSAWGAGDFAKLSGKR